MNIAVRYRGHFLPNKTTVFALCVKLCASLPQRVKLQETQGLARMYQLSHQNVKKEYFFYILTKKRLLGFRILSVYDIFFINFETPWVNF